MRTFTGLTENPMDIQGIYPTASQTAAKPLPQREANQFVALATAAVAESVEAAEIALQRSRSAAIRAFAMQVMVEHTRAATELEGLAYPRYLRGADDPAASEPVRELLELDDENFDSAYIDTQVQVHASLLELFARGVDEQDDLLLQDFARANLPVFQHYLQQARLLAEAQAPH